MSMVKTINTRRLSVVMWNEQTQRSADGKEGRTVRPHISPPRPRASVTVPQYNTTL